MKTIYSLTFDHKIYISTSIEDLVSFAMLFTVVGFAIHGEADSDLHLHRIL